MKHHPNPEYSIPHSSTEAICSNRSRDLQASSCHSFPFSRVKLSSSTGSALERWIRVLHSEMDGIAKPTVGMSLERTRQCFRNRRILMHVYDNYSWIIEDAIERMKSKTSYTVHTPHEISLL